MLADSLTWVISNIGFLGAIGGLLVFVWFGRRRQSLEIEKLTLEIGKLKEETRIHRPTLQEIEIVRKSTERIATRRLGFTGGSDPLEEFGTQLHHFLKVLSAYYGDAEARLDITKQRLAAAMQHIADPYPAGFEHHPDPRFIVAKWAHVRELAIPKLGKESVQHIDAVMNRFSTGRNAA